MRHIITAFLFTAAAATTISAFRPKVDYQPEFIEVTDYQRQDTCLRLKVNLKHFPGYWVSISKDSYLIDRNDTTRKFKAIGAENLSFDKHIYMKDSAHLECVILFEPVPGDINMVDLRDETDDDPSHVIYGIHLDEEDSGRLPDFISPASIMQGESKEKWTGLNPDNYSDIPNYTPGGQAFVRGKILNYTPEAGFSTIMFRVSNEIIMKDKVTVNDIDPDGSFGFEVPLDYPQFAYMQFNDNGKYVFLNPGDTLDIVTTTVSDYKNPKDGFLKYFLFSGKLNDATAVNILSDSISRHFSLAEKRRELLASQNDTSANRILDYNKKIYALLDEAVAGLPGLLGKVPVNDYVKDMTASKVISDIIEIAYDNELTYRSYHSFQVTVDSLGHYTFSTPERLDAKALFEPRQKHLKAIYHNPLMISTGWMLPNRWRFSDLFYDSAIMAEGSLSPGLTLTINKLIPEETITDTKDILELSSYDVISKIDEYNLGTTGVGNCFAAQLSRVSDLVEESGLHHITDRTGLLRLRKLIGNLASMVEYPSLNNALLDAYAAAAEDLAVAESGSVKKSEYKEVSFSQNPDVLTELIKPYLGNLIYIDFWGLGCGPCRAGMEAQKPILDKFADKPFKTLYVAENTNLAAANRWLDKLEIKGEHIFLSKDDWNRLSAYFNFTGIPFGVLIDKDGNLLKTHFNLSIHNEKEILRHLDEM